MSPTAPTASTRDRLLAATVEQFRARGYQGTKLAEVALAAEATIGSLYHFFPAGKVELGIAALDDANVAYLALFDLVAAETDGTGPALVTAFFDGAAEALAEGDFLELCPIGSVAREMSGLDDQLRDATAAIFTGWIERMTDVLVGAEVPATTAPGLATTIITALEGSFGIARTMRDASIVRTTGARLAELVEAASGQTSTAASRSRSASSRSAKRSS